MTRDHIAKISLHFPKLWRMALSHRTGWYRYRSMLQITENCWANGDPVTHAMLRRSTNISWALPYRSREGWSTAIPRSNLNIEIERNRLDITYQVCSLYIYIYTYIYIHIHNLHFIAHCVYIRIYIRTYNDIQSIILYVHILCWSCCLQQWIRKQEKIARKVVQN